MEKITMFKASDGTVFDNENAAKAHEKQAAISVMSEWYYDGNALHFYDKYFNNTDQYRNEVPFIAVVDWLKKHQNKVFSIISPINYIQQNFQPEEVFSEKKLSKWACDHYSLTAGMYDYDI